MYFEELVKRISPTLKRITYKLNGHFSYFGDEDLYQEALVYLWEQFCKGRLEGNTDSYILQGCYFHLKNYLRKIKDKSRLVSLETLIGQEDRDLEEVLCKEFPGVYFDNLENDILLEHIQNNGFSEREKEVLSFSLEGLTSRQIGERLGISHVRVVKIKKRLRKKITFLKT